MELLKRWECGICLQGIEESNELVAAHDAQANGKYVLHVFHNRCLQKWNTGKSKCHNLCPTCKQVLNIRPLSDVWVAGQTTLALMGVNPYMVMVE